MVGVGGSVHSDAPDFLNLVFSFFPLFLSVSNTLKDLHCLRMRYQKEIAMATLLQLHFAFNGPFGDAWLSSLNRLLSRLIRNLVFCEGMDRK